MAAINLDDLYNNYIDQGFTPKEAATNVAWAALTKSDKNLPKYLTRGQWVEAKSPTFMQYKGLNPATASPQDAYVKTVLTRITKDPKEEFTLNTVNELTENLQLPANGGWGYQQAFDFAKGLYDEIESGKNAYEAQEAKGTHSKFGLPSPNAKWAAPLKIDTKLLQSAGTDATKLAKAITYTKNNAKTGTYAYEPMQAWAMQKVADYVNSGKTATEVRDFVIALNTGLQKRLNSGNVTPFVHFAKKKVKGGK